MSVYTNQTLSIYNQFHKSKEYFIVWKNGYKKAIMNINTITMCIKYYMNKFMVKRLLLLDHLRVIFFRFTSMDFSWNQVMDLLATTIGINHVFIMLHVSMEQVTAGTRFSDHVAAISHMTHW